IRSSMLSGYSVEEIHDLTKIDPWFLDQLAELVEHERGLAERGLKGLQGLDAEYLRQTKRLGYSDPQIAAACGCTAIEVRAHRKRLGVVPTYKLVDTCAAEFESYTPYFYSTY